MEHFIGGSTQFQWCKFMEQMLFIFGSQQRPNTSIWSSKDEQIKYNQFTSQRKLCFAYKWYQYYVSLGGAITTVEVRTQYGTTFNGGPMLLDRIG